jgi:hypothetical protein
MWPFGIVGHVAAKTKSGSSSSKTEPTSGRMHYFPAALIGQFGQPIAGKAARDRRVWVARRGHASPHLAPARTVGLDRAYPQIYGSAADLGLGFGLDDLWQTAERHLARTAEAVEDALQGRTISAETFVMSVTPFVAHLLARHPMLAIEPGPPSDLRSHDAKPPGSTLERRHSNSIGTRSCTAGAGTSWRLRRARVS